MQKSDNKFLLSEPDLASRYGKTVRTLQRWRSEGYGPAYMRIGGSILYRIEDVEAFEGRMRKYEAGTR